MARKRRNRKKRPLRKAVGSWVLNVAIGLLLILNILFIYSLVDRAMVSSQTARSDIQRVIQVEVLNGCGETGLAREMTEYLRQRGFDVIEVANAESFNFYKSMVIDRVGNPAIAEQVAQAIGLNPENVIQQKNEYLACDATLIIGRDYRKWKPFKR